jgi:hypothetical protein
MFIINNIVSFLIYFEFPLEDLYIPFHSYLYLELEL